MHKLYSDGEITRLLKEMVIVTDSREQVNGHVLGYFDKYKIAHTSRKLDTGDYSVMIGDTTFETDVCIERKASIDEIAGNFTASRQRFEDEFMRAKASDLKVFLLIENCTWQDILSHNYVSQLKPQSLMASLLAWQVRFNVTLIFCQPEQTGQIIHGILHYWLREVLKNGRV